MLFLILYLQKSSDKANKLGESDKLILFVLHFSFFLKFLTILNKT